MKKDKYKCEQCEFQTEYKANLQRHIENQHKKWKYTAQVDDKYDEGEKKS